MLDSLTEPQSYFQPSTPETTDSLVVQKFGGTSVSAIHSLASYIRASSGRKLVVVSALVGVTNLLHDLIENPTSENYNKIVEFHQAFLSKNGINLDLSDLYHELDQLAESLSSDSTGIVAEKIKGWGERVSSKIVSTYLRAPLVDSSSLIQLDASCEVLRDATRSACEGAIPGLFESSDVVVAPGYIASKEGQFTTLGRGGSDYSAGIFAEALNANRVEICKEVSGIMTADPRTVPKAKTVRNLSREATAKAAASGVNALHPLTIEALRQNSTPVYVTNTFEPLSSNHTIVQAAGPFKQGVQLITSQGSTVTLIGHDLTSSDFEPATATIPGLELLNSSPVHATYQLPSTVPVATAVSTLHARFFA